MDGLIRFDNLALDANTGRPDTPQLDTFPSAQVIEQLRHRLIGQDYHDTVETRVAIVGELVYFCYRELLKRRML